jgi:hypothetical protein
MDRVFHLKIWKHLFGRYCYAQLLKDSIKIIDSCKEIK